MSNVTIKSNVIPKKKNISLLPKRNMNILEGSKPRCVLPLALPQLNPSVPVGGRLGQFLPFWLANVADKWARAIVQNGYYIPFKTVPQLTNKVRRTFLPSHQHQVLWEEIEEMKKKNAIEQVDPKTTLGFYSTFFLVPKKDGGRRPVLNLKGLNKFIQITTFKMQTPQLIISHLQQGVWLASLDLKDAYFHVPIRPDHRPYLRFEFQGQVFQFKVLPFGLSTAPRVFTKMLAPVIGLLHSRGIHIFPYLDDCLIVAKTKDQLIQAVHTSQDVLMQAGFIINVKKSHLTPVQRLKFLGLELDSTVAAAFLPEDRAQQIVQCTKYFSEVGMYRPVQLYLRLLGLMAASLLTIPNARLYMRPIQIYLNSQRDARIHGLQYPVMVPKRLLPIMKWWSNLDNLLVGLPWSQPRPSITLTTDASQKAWGAHLKNMSVQGRWTKHQRALHINILEFLAVQKGLKTFQHLLRKKSVLIRADNATVISYINKAGGTKSPHLCQIAWDIGQWCLEHQVLIQALHIPGKNNLLADKLSRQLLSPTEWELNDRVVQKLFSIWTTPTMDLFANVENRKLPEFCSLFPHPLACHQDALEMSWDKMFAYAFPPLAILNQVLRKVASERVILILIAPQWTRREWYPLLLDLLIDVPYRLPVLWNIVTQEQGTHLHHNPAELSLVAWLVSGIPSLHRAFLKGLQQRVWHPRVRVPTKTISQAGSVFLPGVQQRILIPINQLLLP